MISLGGLEGRHGVLPYGAFRRAGHRTRLNWMPHALLSAGGGRIKVGGESASIPKPQDVGDTHRKAGRTPK